MSVIEAHCASPVFPTQSADIPAIGAPALTVVGETVAQELAEILYLYIVTALFPSK